MAHHSAIARTRRRLGAAATRLLANIELTTAALTIVYIAIIIADMVVGEVISEDDCEAGSGSDDSISGWRDAYTIADLSFLSFFACEITLRLLSEGKMYLHSPLNLSLIHI